MDEIWLPVKGFEGLYEVSNIGNVKSSDRIVECLFNGKLLYKNYRSVVRKPSLDTAGYLFIPLSVLSKHTMKRVHRMVAEAFLTNDNNLPQVNHINGIKTDNRVENLEWCTASENTIHAVSSGLTRYNGFSVVATNKHNSEVLEFRSYNDAGKKLSIHPRTIKNKCNHISDNEFKGWVFSHK